MPVLCCVVLSCVVLCRCCVVLCCVVPVLCCVLRFVQCAVWQRTQMQYSCIRADNIKIDPYEKWRRGCASDGANLLSF